ncbi:hypothetical protein TNCV_89781 [Trichonephila clavipes]|nr:hypothetical protein TNCV_89781 [Trichonephila clavipes]
MRLVEESLSSDYRFDFKQSTYVTMRFECHGGRDSLVVKITDSWLACLEFKPIAAEDPLCGGGRCMLNLSKFKHPPIGLEAWRVRCHPSHSTEDRNYEVRRQQPMCNCRV